VLSGDDRTVYFGSDNGFFHAVDAKTGKRRWVYRIGDGADPTDSVLSPDGTIVYFGTLTNEEGSEGVFALDTDSGKQRWKFKTGDWIRSSPGERAYSPYSIAPTVQHIAPTV
jgi:outer membrane protein assembly factor BamB